MKKFALTPEEYGDLTEYEKYIANFGMNETHKAQCWNEMVNRFAHVDHAPSMKEFIEADEEVFMLKLESQGHTVRNSRGKLSMNVAMPSSTYRSAKSVLYKAKVEGVKVIDAEGNPRGKTAVERDTRAKRQERKEDDFISMEEFVDQATVYLDKMGANVGSRLTGRKAEFYGKVAGVLDKLIKDEEPPF